MKSTMKLKRLQYADKVSGTLKGSMFFLRSTQNLQKVFLSALALHIGNLFEHRGSTHHGQISKRREDEFDTKQSEEAP